MKFIMTFSIQEKPLVPTGQRYLYTSKLIHFILPITAENLSTMNISRGYCLHEGQDILILD